MIRAGLEGIRAEKTLPPMETACGKLPLTLRQAITAANRGSLGRQYVPEDVLDSYFKNKQELANAYTRAKKKAEYDRQTYFALL